MGWGRQRYQQVDLSNSVDTELVETSSGSPSSFGQTNSTTNLVEKADRPEIDISTGRKPSWRVPGWRVGAVLATSGVFFTLITNVALSIAIPHIYGLENGISTIYTGSCSQTEKANTLIHLGINLLSTLLLSGSNYCMQCLSAPTRADIDNAHRNRRWLDIGVPSIRNIRAIGAKKSILWWGLGVSSVPLHLLYNSVFFSAISTNNYRIAWVTEGFSEGAPFNRTKWFYEQVLDRVPLTEIQEKAATFDNLTNEECIRAYAKDFVSARRDVLLVVDSQDAPQTEIGDSVLGVVDNQLDPGLDSQYSWICDEYGIDICSAEVPSILSGIANGDAWENLPNSPEASDNLAYRIKYCLSEPSRESCSLHFSLNLIIVVIVCNVGKLVAMAAIIMWLHSSKPLITIGDAIDSFMTRNDPYVTGMCLAPWKTLRKATYHSTPIPFKHQKKKCGQAVSLLSWSIVLFLFLVALATVIALLMYGITHIQGASDAKSLWNLGFGAVRASSLIVTNTGLPYLGGSGLISAVLLANTPQPILSFLYLLFNSLCTSMLLAHEWGSYQLERKPLRVSDPRGRQRSSYFLQLPYRYAGPLMVMSSALHWGVSQSIFLARINILDSRWEDETMTTCGYSPPAMVFTLIMGSLLLLGGIALGFKKINSDMPIASSCSSAIAAACETSSLVDDDNDPSMPLQWGVVSSESHTPHDVGHCCFTAGQVTAPVEGRLYAGVRERRKDKHSRNY